MAYDSDDAATGEYNYNRRKMSSSYGRDHNPTSSLDSKKKSRFSDDDDDDDYGRGNYGRGTGARLNSSRNNYQNGARGGADSSSPPLSPYKSLDTQDMLYMKPPSGRFNQASARSDYSLSSARKQLPPTTNYLTPTTVGSSSANKLTNSNNNDPDSDDSFMQRYNKFAKKAMTSDLIDDSKLNTSAKLYTNNLKYDTYDEDDKDDRFKKSLSSNKNTRSSSLDRLGNNLLGASLNSTYGKTTSKFNSTTNVNGIDNSSDRSYTITSLNSTSMSVREAKSRSFLVGSLSALNGKGLLSSEELDRCFLDRKARVLVATWNMGGVKKLPSNLDDLVLPDSIQTIPDLVIIGAQEFELNQKEWEISLQEHVGPTHVKLSSYYHGSIGIVIFIKRDLIWYCSVVEYEHLPLRAVHAPGKTKSSVLITFQLFGTLMCFICSHFMAGEGNLEQRVENYKSTISNIKLPKQLSNKPRVPGADGTDNFDVVFWFGDFNFLVTKERDKIEKKVNYLREKRGNTNYEDIVNHDELNQVMTQDVAFKNFIEGRITFEPTYKYDVGTDTYDTSHKVRIPSYCDRILFKSRHKNAISCYYYDTIKDIKLSDHRAVYGLYEVSIRPGVDKTPLSYGDFDRQVYAAAYQRRQMFRAANVPLKNNSTKSNANAKNSTCIIQ